MMHPAEVRVIDKIELYSGGMKVAEWRGTGMVRKQAFEGVSFKDVETGKKVYAIGTLVITELDRNAYEHEYRNRAHEHRQNE